MQTALKAKPEHVYKSAKEQAAALLAKMPETATLNDIQYEMYVLAAIEEGAKDIAEGRVVSHEEVVRQFEEWRGT
jgi:predicted transcriptional regulator